MSLSNVQFDADGFLQRAEDWDPALAAEIASRDGIGPLEETHFKVIEAMRAHFFAHGTLPVMRQICSETGLEHHCVSDLLDDPRRAWRIAGLPNPGEEAIAYMPGAEAPK